MMVDGSFQEGTALVKEGAVFLEEGERGRTSWSKGDIDRRRQSEFLFVLEKLNICCSNKGLLVFNGYHVYFTTSIPRKLVSDEGC